MKDAERRLRALLRRKKLWDGAFAGTVDRFFDLRAHAPLQSSLALHANDDSFPHNGGKRNMKIRSR
jgi:hypothetical protein